MSIGSANSSGNTRSISTSFIKEWKSESGTVCLFRMENDLAFANGRNGLKFRFKPLPHSIQYASNLVLMFQKTIAANLEEDKPHPYSFIPLLLKDAGIEPKAQLALFGRVSPLEGEGVGALKGLRWGVFYPATREEQIIEVDDPCSRECVRWAPHFQSLQHEQISQQIAEYAKRFTFVLGRDESGRIQKISLKHQRTWYESDGRSCSRALMDYLLQCDLASLQTLRQLGLAPEQIVNVGTESEIAYFRTLLQELKSRSENDQKSIFANLEKKYPMLFEPLLQELIERANHQPAQSDYQSILTTLRQGVLGQDTAAEFLAASLSAQRQNDGNAVFLFVGPTGVGKTEIAKVAASLKGDRFVKFDMDQFKGQVDFYKLFGAAAGYVGSTDKPLFARELDKYASPLPQNDGSVLTRTVTDAIIVFDELEKAHSEVKQSLLTLFDEGYCKVQYTSDHQNLVIKYLFYKCIFIATSNLFKEKIVEGFKRGDEPDTIANYFIQLNSRQPGSQSYSPELLGRMKVVAFGPIPRGEVYQSLLRSKLPSFLTVLQTAVNCPSVKIAEADLPAVLNLLESKLYGDGTGIRNVKSYFEQEIKTAIYKQHEWVSLENKYITIVPYNPNRLGLKCVKTIFGRVIHEYPVVPI